MVARVGTTVLRFDPSPSRPAPLDHLTCAGGIIVLQHAGSSEHGCVTQPLAPPLTRCALTGAVTSALGPLRRAPAVPFMIPELLPLERGHPDLPGRSDDIDDGGYSSCWTWRDLPDPASVTRDGGMDISVVAILRLADDAWRAPAMCTSYCELSRPLLRWHVRRRHCRLPVAELA